MFANRRRFRDAVRRSLTPSEAWVYVDTILVLNLPYPRWMVLAFLDHAAPSNPIAAAYAKAIRGGSRRVQVRRKTVKTKVLAGDALTLAETAREVATDPGVAEALREFQPE